jgi:LmbE family N-acetylglucosaminyl deacetylase
LAGSGTSEQRWRGWRGLRDAPEVCLDALVPPNCRAVVVAPHPDDEVLGCGGILAMLAAQQRATMVIGVTDGEASHAGCRGWRAAHLARRRRRERSVGLACLGHLPAIDLALPDGSVLEYSSLLDATLSDLLRPPDVVFVTSRIDGHPDHEACAMAVDRVARRQRCRVVEVPVWLWHWAEPGDLGVEWSLLRRLALTPDALRRKQAAIEAHASQLAPLHGREAIVASWALERLMRPYECFFVREVTDEAR